ncbi:MAG TPA: hypothetical protein VIT42_11375 [Microlunatus sp.]
MQDGDEIREQKRRCNRAVLIGVIMMGAALLTSAWDLLPQLFTTLAAVVGFAHLMYGVHVGWQVFYDREHDGPSS